MLKKNMYQEVLANVRQLCSYDPDVHYEDKMVWNKEMKYAEAGYVIRINFLRDKPDLKQIFRYLNSVGSVSATEHFEHIYVWMWEYTAKAEDGDIHIQLYVYNPLLKYRKNVSCATM